MLEPYLLDETASYAVAYKPPQVHSVPLKHEKCKGKTLLDWCAKLFPELYTVQGKNPWEGGILHRLDYETQGLVLFAKTQDAMNALSVQQESGLFTKEYNALSAPNNAPLLQGFPPKHLIGKVPSIIQSGFRAYGRGRQAVRPVMCSWDVPARKGLKDIVLDQGNPYRTRILEIHNTERFISFHVQISRGFRHQIRCHLAWTGFPLLNDFLYGGTAWEEAPLKNQNFSAMALIAKGISFYDPVSGIPRKYTIPDFL